MADIELVIKIPEETYKDIQSHDWKNGGRWYSEEWKAIHNGTVLPEHGRLIDADELKKNAYSASAFTQVVDVSDIDNAPTILGGGTK